MSYEHVLQLTVLPERASVARVVECIDSETWLRIRPFLPRLPLLHLLILLLDELGKSRTVEDDSMSRDALLELGLMAIAKHEYSRNLYATLVTALEGKSASDLLESIPATDGLLALQMLAFTAEALGETESKDLAIRCFELQLTLSDILGLTGNKAITHHQLGIFLLRQGDVSSAESAFKNAANGFLQNAPDLFRRTNALRVLIYCIRLRYQPDAILPDDLAQFLQTDSVSAAQVNLARAKSAIDKDDLKRGENLLLQAKSLCGDKESLRYELLMLEARLMRRKGRPEKADFLRREATSLVPYEQHSDELKWETFYFARDNKQFDRAKLLLANLRDNDPKKHAYQRALIAFEEGDSERARSLFQECLLNADDDLPLANCYGMLALIGESRIQSQEYLHKAIGLYVKTDQKLDHAICLSHLAILKVMEGLEWQERGMPQIAISQFPRAAGYFAKAFEIAESLGIDAFCVELSIKRGHLEVARRRYKVAYNQFDKARIHLELIYLRSASPELLPRYANKYTSCCLAAVDAALRAQDVNLAFVAAERVKARRMLRDVSESWLAAAMRDSEGSTAAEDLILNVIRPIRTKILEQRPLSLAERRQLSEAEDALRRLSPEVGTIEVGAEKIEYINEPLALHSIRNIVFGAERGEKQFELKPPPDQAEQELPGGGTITCADCGVLNQIGSSFCSACEGLLPKLVSVNLDVLMGNATEEELKVAFAEYLYNHAIQEFADGDFQGAEKLLGQAIEHHSNPDYFFFHGMCRLVADDAERALRDFSQVKELQFAGKYPFWPLPVSPSELETNVAALENGEPAAQVFKDLYLAHHRFFSKRSAGQLPSDE
jgi:tetratricopeptide (TPR) repeat protein